MNHLRHLLFVATIFSLPLFGKATAVEELAAPTNAIPDLDSLDAVPLTPADAEQQPLDLEGTPVSPYDVVPFEDDPAINAYRGHHVPFSDPYHGGFDPYHVNRPDAFDSRYANGHDRCTTPKVKYWNHPLLAKQYCRCDCGQTVETLLPVPCQCCPVMVKVCVPVCCVGAPTCDVNTDLLGRKVYLFQWPCGYLVKIVDRHSGTLVVHTYNA